MSRIAASGAPTHVAYSDESQHDPGCFRAVGLVTLRLADAPGLSRELRRLLDESSIGELKWNRLRTARERFAAIKVIDRVVGVASERRLRVDVLAWRAGDCPRPLGRADGVPALARMYRLLVHRVLGELWPEDAVWRLCPDENSAVNWPAFEEWLLEPQADPVAPAPGLRLLSACRSQDEPLIQAADLFAGLGLYAWAGADRYARWLETHDQVSGPPPEQEMEDGVALTRSDRERCTVLAFLEARCRRSGFVPWAGPASMGTADAYPPLCAWRYDAAGGDLAAFPRPTLPPTPPTES